MFGSRRDQHQRSGAYRPLTPATLAYRELRLPIEPEEFLVIPKMALASEQHMKAPISKAAAFMRQRLHPLAKVVVIAATGFVTDRHPA